jgi:hypothetical protein
MWQAVLWLTVIGLIQIVTFLVMVLFVRLALRDRKREVARRTPSDAIPAAVAPEEPQLVGSQNAREEHTSAARVRQNSATRAAYSRQHNPP